MSHLSGLLQLLLRCHDIQQKSKIMFLVNYAEFYCYCSRGKDYYSQNLSLASYIHYRIRGYCQECDYQTFMLDFVVRIRIQKKFYGRNLQMFIIS
jgi:hypothetical protein